MKRKAQSIGRMLRRQSMKAQGVTFKDRLYEAVRTGQPVKTINFVAPKPRKEAV